jgi:hypothetical protein
MNRVTLDASMRAKLNDLTRPLEFCDEAGHVLGRFTPTPHPSLYEGLEPQISREELERRKRSKGKTYSTAQVLEHLEKL